MFYFKLKDRCILFPPKPLEMPCLKPSVGAKIFSAQGSVNVSGSSQWLHFKSTLWWKDQLPNDFTEIALRRAMVNLCMSNFASSMQIAVKKLVRR